MKEGVEVLLPQDWPFCVEVRLGTFKRWCAVAGPYESLEVAKVVARAALMKEGIVAVRVVRQPPPEVVFEASAGK